jgi:excisionase family DNA binding protein
MPAARNEPQFLTVKEFAKTLNIGTVQAYNAIHSGEVRAIKIGGSYRIPDDEIDRLKRGRPPMSPTAPLNAT